MATLWRQAFAARLVANGGVVAYPTEGVWGLGCMPADARAVFRILDLKSRPVDKGLILVGADVWMFEPFLEGLTGAQYAELEASWPGPTTYLVPDNGAAPYWITGAHDKVALRVSNHPVTQELCRAVGGPLVSTSANPAGRAPARSSLQVRRYFGDDVDYVYPGSVGGRPGPSEIRDLLSGAVIRSG